VYIFSLILGLGAGLGLVWAAWQASEKQASLTISVGLGVLLGGLLGGRVAYVVINWLHFQAHPLEIPQVWLGGMSGIGTLAGAVLALPIIAAVLRQPPGALADDLLPLAAFLIVAAWLACWLDGCAYGPAVHAWWGIPSKDEMGNIATRWPTQLFGAILTLGLLAALDWGRRRLQIPGLAASLGLLGLSLELFGLSFLRADPAPLWRDLRLDVWGALGLAGVAVLCIILILIRRRMTTA
jgi:phosphatidylglycerol:prolipoprotein diacylglycerol transferase